MLFDFDNYIQQPLPFRQEITRFLNTNDSLIIFDVGSCEGEDTIRLKRLFPNATIYTFEPLPENMKKVKTNLTRHNIPTDHLYKIALSNSNGSAEFHVSSGQPDNVPKNNNWDFGNKSSSLLPPKEHKNTLPWIKFDQIIRVKTRRLDDFCQSQDVSFIDFVYMDVQGAELMVLEGAGDQLKTIGALWMEVEAVELYEAQPLKNDVEAFMKQHGFVRVMDTVDNISGDQLYINQKLHKKRRSTFNRLMKLK